MLALLASSCGRNDSVGHRYVARLDAETLRGDCEPGRTPRWKLVDTFDGDLDAHAGAIAFRQRAATNCRFPLEIPPGARMSFSLRADAAARPQRGNARIAVAVVGAAGETLNGAGENAGERAAAEVVFEAELEPGRPLTVDALALNGTDRSAAAIELRHTGGRRAPAAEWLDVTLEVETPNPTPPSGWRITYTDAVERFAAAHSEWPPPAAAKPRLLVVGIDGASWPLTDELIEAGDVPNLAALVARGRRGRLESTFIPESAMAWTSLRTGVTSGEHGVYNFMSRDRTRRSYWTWLEDAGLRSIVIGVPKTSPYVPFGGILVGGWNMNAKEAYTRPRDLAIELAPTGYQPGIANVADTARFAERMRTRTDLALALLGRLDWDHAFVVYEYSDTASHRFGLRTEGWRSAYRQLDRELGRLLGGLPADTNVLVVSDHGWRRFDRAVSPDAWLRANGYTSWMTNIYGGHRVALQPTIPLAPEEAAEAIDALREGLREFVDPQTGEPIVKRVVSVTEAIPGPFSERSNLSVFIEFDPRYHAAAKARGDDPWPDVTPEHHDVDGLYLLAGPDVTPGAGRDAGILDIAPTIAAFFGVLPPEDVVGRPLDGLAVRAPRTATAAIGLRSPKRRDRAGDEAGDGAPSPELRESLRALGYIDEAD